MYSASNRITRDGAKFLSNFLKADTYLETLDLGNNRIEDDGCIFLAEALMISNTHLKKLSIKYNRINAEGLCALFKALESVNKTLTHVFIWGNNLEELACIVSV